MPLSARTQGVLALLSVFFSIQQIVQPYRQVIQRGGCGATSAVRSMRERYGESACGVLDLQPVSGAVGYSRPFHTLVSGVRTVSDQHGLSLGRAALDGDPTVDELADSVPPVARHSSRQRSQTLCSGCSRGTTTQWSSNVAQDSHAGWMVLLISRKRLRIPGFLVPRLDMTSAARSLLSDAAVSARTMR